jgi:DNA-binding response OmpR family regulator
MSNKTPLLVFQGQLNRGLIDVLVSEGWSPQRVVDINELVNQASSLLKAANDPSDVVCIESNVCPPLEKWLESQVLVIIPSIKTSLRSTQVQTARSTHQCLPQSKIYHIGDLMIDLQAWQVTLNGQAITLSVTEFSFLAYLAERSGQVVSYEELLTSVWDYSAGTGSRKVVTNCVRRLRKKLAERAECPEYVVSVPSIGYRLRNQQQWERWREESI